MNNTASLIEYIQKTQPKVIFWDVGQVLIDINFRKDNELTAEHFGLTYHQLKEFISGYFHDYILGEIRPAEVDTMFTQQFGIQESLTQYQQKVYEQIIIPNQELLDWIDSTGEEVYHSVISNIYPMSLQSLQKMGITRRFQRPIFSCEYGLAKPDPQIFYAALSQFTEFVPSECLFVDDKVKHLNVAQELGIDIQRYTTFLDDSKDDFTNI